jgi:hypothetical protein
LNWCKCVGRKNLNNVLYPLSFCFFHSITWLSNTILDMGNCSRSKKFVVCWKLNWLYFQKIWFSISCLKDRRMNFKINEWLFEGLFKFWVEKHFVFWMSLKFGSRESDRRMSGPSIFSPNFPVGEVFWSDSEIRTFLN